MAGSNNSIPVLRGPQWLLLELTYRCPLKCPYCSNPLALNSYRQELSTQDFKRILEEARSLGALQLGFSGGEPLLRGDLEELVGHARKLGYYTNLITSGWDLTEDRLQNLISAGIDHIQLSFQSASETLNNELGGLSSFRKKKEAAGLIKKYQIPMVLNFVIHRYNMSGEEITAIIELSLALGADYLELANVQFYGHGLKNRQALLPTPDQIREVGAVVQAYQEKLRGRLKIFYVLSDYYENRPKSCGDGWAKRLMVIAPNGTVYPCHGASILPQMNFPNVKDRSLEWIWRESPAFNRFRGLDWMKSPCQECPEKEKDYGGCRCQAFLLTGDPAAADPVCDKSPLHDSLAKAPLQREPFQYRSWKQ